MRLIEKVIRIPRAKFHCSRLTTVQDIQDHASVIFLAHGVEIGEVFRGYFCTPLLMLKSTCYLVLALI